MIADYLVVKYRDQRVKITFRKHNIFHARYISGFAPKNRIVRVVTPNTIRKQKHGRAKINATELLKTVNTRV